MSKIILTKEEVAVAIRNYLESEQRFQSLAKGAGYIEYYVKGKSREDFEFEIELKASK